jgi:hypothetical protein
MAAPKFYLFDVGVANFLARQSVNELKGMAAGKILSIIFLWSLSRTYQCIASEWIFVIGEQKPD